MSAGTLRRGYPAGIRAAAPDWTNAIDTEGRPALVLVEGIYDVEFLCRISTVLHRDDHAIPELRMLEEAGRVIFVPFGGGDCIRRSDNKAGGGEWRAARFHSAQMIIC